MTRSGAAKRVLRADLHDQKIDILSNKGSFGKLLFFIFFLFGIWIIRINLYPLIDERAPTDFVNFYISNYLRLLFWITPLLIFFIGSAANWLKMFGLQPFKTIDAFAVSLLIAELVLAIFLDVRFQPAAITDQVWIKVGSVIILGPLVEEITFRGYIFPELSSYINYWWGAIISSILFALIHFPIWIYKGTPAHEMLISSAVAFTFAMLMCWLTKSSKSLYPAFAAHGLNNLIVLFIQG